MEYVIEAENLTIMYDSVKAVEGLTFKLKKGETLLLLGPNGAGKTTLLRVLAGLHTNYQGKILVFGKSPSEVREKVAYVPQTFSLNFRVPLSVLDVVSMGGLYKKGLIHFNIPQEVIKRGLEILDFLGLKEIAKKSFRELSGGQKQRVIIARALMSNPELLLLDEPLSALDPKARIEATSTLSKIKEDMGITMIITTHDVNPLIEIGDKVMLIDRKLVAFGSPEEVLRDEIIGKVYGPASKAVRVGERLYCIIGDVHFRVR
ncbi:ABC transporter ATP-binding protein [Pyrococcus abyssi GE5]|uniref:ABC transporter ATP-binding protein n=1 Tax=Pyrococcus abyssi (strain GE5 / Orsay) TaxID=272844 RepID=Q9V1B1_PYRAB|nr:ATP-binding cassette domain-containing protein [Pyrococcus abyssi]CAB49438.1 ABC transporter ATP-binding protein [Pyrococcus abyssi GE5]CCE69905.1 TPA: ABC transporter ATP-binding protein [Pyrococcus abyssi GE5]